MIDAINEDPFLPSSGKNCPGMQPQESLSEENYAEGVKTWLEMKDYLINVSRKLEALGFHKQIANRPIDVVSYMNVILTTTLPALENFFELRDHPAAQYEIQVLARAMKEALNSVTPRVLENGEWHLPFIRETEKHLPIETLLKVSTSRCARISYFTHEGKESTVEEDERLWTKLAGSHPIHASPLEHQATPDDESLYPEI